MRSGAGCLRRADNFCEHTEVCVHGDERQFWQYVQHGWRIPRSAVSPLAAQADFVDQSTNRFPGDDDRDRPGR